MTNIIYKNLPFIVVGAMLNGLCGLTIRDWELYVFMVVLGLSTQVRELVILKLKAGVKSNE